MLQPFFCWIHRIYSQLILLRKKTVRILLSDANNNLSPVVMNVNQDLSFTKRRAKFIATISRLTAFFQTLSKFKQSVLQLKCE